MVATYAAKTTAGRLCVATASWKSSSLVTTRRDMRSLQVTWSTSVRPKIHLSQSTYTAVSQGTPPTTRD